MATRKSNRKSKKSNKRFRRTRSKRQSGGNPSENGCTETLNFLLDNGADVNVTDESGWTALSRASGRGDAEIVTLLLKKGADVNPNTGSVPLSQASYNRHPEIVKILLTAGADVNAYDDHSQSTALMWASYYGNPEIVEMLLDEGADVNMKDHHSKTALDIASSNNFWPRPPAGTPETIKLLKQHIVAQTIPRHLERQQERLNVGRVMDSKRMPEDLTHKIITEHFGGKRKSKKSKRKSRRPKKSKRKTRRK